MFRIDPDNPFNGPHQTGDVLVAGPDPLKAEFGMILIHGRGASPEGILRLTEELDEPDFAFLAPRATGNSWYPRSFLNPVELNQPGLNSALQVVYDLLNELKGDGIPKERVILAGFSQGACLVSEFSVRHPARYGGVVALSGGLIGEHVYPEAYTGSLEGTPVFMGCSDIDPHIPLSRVEESAQVFKQMDADLTKTIYSGMGHTVNEDELEQLRRLAALVKEGV